MDKETKRILFLKVLGEFPMMVNKEEVADALLAIDNFKQEEIDAIVADITASETARLEDQKKEAEDNLAAINAELAKLKVIK